MTVGALITHTRDIILTVISNVVMMTKQLQANKTTASLISPENCLLLRQCSL